MQVSHAFCAWPMSVGLIGLVSHPSFAPDGHMAKPMAWQIAFVHTPPWHAGAFILQALPQAPQFFTSELVFTSQPSATLLLQSANPARHLSNTHMLLMHLLIAPGMLQFWQVQPPLMQVRPWGQTLPHAPQFFTSVPV